MKLVLPSGINAKIGVMFTHNETSRNRTSEMIYRGTRIKLDLDNDSGFHYDAEVRAICRPPDNFCKRSGRRFAAIKLLKLLRNRLGKEDRRTIFMAVCPEYKKM